MTKDEAREILQKLSNGVLTFMEAEAIDCAIQALGDAEEVEPVQDEFTELVDIARHMQLLYRNGRFGLSDEAMTTATAHLDDLRRIPSPPKPKQT